MSRPLQAVYFDGTRLFARRRFSTPTGIDRVDLAYLEALSGMAGVDLRIVRRTPLGIRTMSQGAGLQLARSILGRWATSVDEREQGNWLVLRRWLESPALTPRPRLEAVDSSVRPPPLCALQTLLLPARESARAAEQGLRRPIYINTSHGQLFRPAYRRWLRRRGLQGLFFVHDLIPIKHPEYSRAQEPARHAARLDLIAASAGRVLVNSQATRSELLDYWSARAIRVPEVVVAPLGVGLNAMKSPFPELRLTVPYFVMLGTIEPRKNHAMLLDLWQRLVERDPANAPRLVIAGRRGWLNQAVFDLLDQSPQLAAHVVECAGLADPELVALLRGARALLNPSFAEGFGLPLAEALALGVPVIASDLPAHREVGGVFADYVDPRDRAGWCQAIDAQLRDTQLRQNRLKQLAADFRPPTWNRHFETLREQLLQLQ